MSISPITNPQGAAIAPASLQSDRQWWATQWIDLMNSYRFKKRLERGWIYARKGHVKSILFRDRKVIAKVQGTDPKPYHVSLWLTPLSDEDWQYVVNTLYQRAIFSAKLLAGEMPHNIEEVFSANGLRLFPFNLNDVHSRCNCPDKANPCKHVSAVYYLLGDRFGEDPFVLFQLRGRTREQILTALRQQRQQALGTADSSAALVVPEFHLDPQRYWAYGASLDPSLVVITSPTSGEGLLDVLGPIPLALDGEAGDYSDQQQAHLQGFLRQVYQTVSQQAMIQAMTQGQGKD
ncbi:SWIM zinc finger family protein [Prochlorothrix hollandica]|uniref:SWIM Zn-finger protein n=1 Tax=Prochlorothrix hollandica PCC 9006 = CALU 1027 TaxID=317619 RepID=A0A0M2PSI3_PROHO|nr:SWIM zinc finger family protein [Prochlorothrix hollandica]KKI99084.1 SWIM Zn-finger protein [Prochlorothrix hollandica PCC 9006 = CALU 1027]